jgi:dTDP-4-dehydrorhamnose 3,5-epimerase
VRAGSPTFGEHVAVELNSESCRAVYLAEGLGHAFVALTDDTVMSYLCSTPYNPAGERGISPLDPVLRLPWPPDLQPVLSEKDVAAPTLEEAAASRLLPNYDACMEWYTQLRA